MISDGLKPVLDDADLRSHLRPAAFISGVVFGVSASPDIPMPEKWMPWVLDGNHDVPLKDAAVDELAQGLIAQLQWQLLQMQENQPLLPDNCKWAEDKASRSELEQWLSGLLFAHQQLETVWLDAWDNANISDAQVRLNRCLKCFSVLANSELTLAPLSEEQQVQLKSNLPTLFSQLNPLLKDYVNLAGELAEQLPGQVELYSDTAMQTKH